MDGKALKPGRELDALVAEKVMGWKKIKPPNPSFKLTWMWDRLEGALIEDAQLTPRYSTDIAAAWEVVGKFFKDGKQTAVLSRPWLIPPDYYAWIQYGKRCPGESAPHAICLAALKAVEKSDPKQEAS